MGRIVVTEHVTLDGVVEDNGGVEDRSTSCRRRLRTPGWNTHVLDGDPVERIAELTREVQGDIVVHGSFQLTQTLIDNDLVDELRLMMFPVVLGDGKRLFGATRESKRLRLAESRQLGPDGVLLITYLPATNGEPESGGTGAEPPA